MSSAPTLFRPWMVLAASVLTLLGCARAYFDFGVPLPGALRDGIGFLGFLFFFGALALVGRNVCWRRDHAAYYHPLPRWALMPFTVFFGYMAGALVVQITAFFRVQDLQYLMLVAAVTIIGIADVMRSRRLMVSR